MHIETLNLREVIVFLVAAGVVVPLIRRLRVSPVLGFLVVGLVIGPHGLARFADTLMGTGVPDDAARHSIDARRQAEQAAVDEGRRQQEI